MSHLDEGTMHAWLDGALDAAESARVQAHVSECGACAEQVAEARGLVAASSRILTALDDVPGGVIPAARRPASVPPRAKVRRWASSPWSYGVAAALVLFALWRTGGVQQREMVRLDVSEATKSIPTVASTPVAPPVLQPAPAALTPPSIGGERREIGKISSSRRSTAADSAVANVAVASGAASGLAAPAPVALQRAQTTLGDAQAAKDLASSSQQFTSAPGVDSAPASWVGCYRVARVADTSKLSEVVVTSADGTREAPERRAARARTSASAPPAAGAGAVGGAAARTAKAEERDARNATFIIVRVDQATLAPGATLRAVTSDSSYVNVRSVSADSVHMRAIGYRPMAFGKSDRVSCPPTLTPR